MNILRKKIILVPILLILLSVIFYWSIFGSTCVDTMFDKAGGSINSYMCHYLPEVGLFSSDYERYFLGGIVLSIFLSLIFIFVLIFYLVKKYEQKE